MKYKITNFGQTRTVIVEGTGYYLTGRGACLNTNNAKLAEAAETYPKIEVESEKESEESVESKPRKLKPERMDHLEIGAKIGKPMGAKSTKEKTFVPNLVNMKMKMGELRKIAKGFGFPYDRKDTKITLIEKIRSKS